MGALPSTSATWRLRAAVLAVSLAALAACSPPECRRICGWADRCSDLAAARGESCRQTCREAASEECRDERDALAACLEAAPHEDANACEKTQKRCNAEFAAYQARCLATR